MTQLIVINHKAGIMLPYVWESNSDVPNDAGEVFVTLETLCVLAEQMPGDSDEGYIVSLEWHAGYALEQAGYAVAETTLRYHGTEKLRDLVRELDSNLVRH